MTSLCSELSPNRPMWEKNSPALSHFLTPRFSPPQGLPQRNIADWLHRHERILAVNSRKREDLPTWLILFGTLHSHHTQGPVHFQKMTFKL